MHTQGSASEFVSEHAIENIVCLAYFCIVKAYKNALVTELNDILV